MIRPTSFRLLALGALTAAALLSAGCGNASGSADAAADGPTLDVSGADTMKFTPDTLTVKAGQAVNVVFHNNGVIVHDFISSAADKNVKLANVLGGREARGVFQANKPGIYQVTCQQPGHREAGMVAKIVVE